MSTNNKSSLKIQKNIKDNADELKDFLADLHRWEDDIKEVTSNMTNDNNAKQDIPPVRCKKSEMSTLKTVSVDNKRLKTSNKKQEKISGYDYAAWDKFDVDKALESEEEEEQKSPVSKVKSHQPSQNLKDRAVKLKDEGNKAYTSGRLDEAIAKYTQGMALDPTNAILLANRAMAYIKIEKYEAAETDCSKCLKLDEAYIKAYLRRGTARLKLKKIKLAKHDFKKVLELEPWNKDAKKELEKLENEKQIATNSGENVQKNNKESIGTVLSNNTINNNKNTSTTTKAVITNTEKSDPSKEVSVSKNNNNAKQEEVSKKSVKIKITEIDSSKDQAIKTSLEKSNNSNIVIPVSKLPHQRSQKPMKKIRVSDVPSEDSIPKYTSSNKTKESLNKEKLQKSKESLDEQKARKSKEPLDKEKLQEEIFPTKSPKKQENSSSKKENTSSTNTSIASLPSVPHTSHQFSQDWNRLLSQERPLAVQYLKTIPGNFFQNKDLEADVLVDVLSALKEDQFSNEECISYLGGLSQSTGFSLNMMFLDESQKKVINELLEKCKAQEKSHADVFKRVKSSLM